MSYIVPLLVIQYLQNKYQKGYALVLILLSKQTLELKNFVEIYI